MRLDHGYYSVPWQRIGERLWVRATAEMVSIFHDHELVASHSRCARPGESRTVDDHLPPEAQAFLRQTQCETIKSVVAESAKLPSVVAGLRR